MSEHTKEPWITVETELDVIEITNADRNGDTETRRQLNETNVIYTTAADALATIGTRCMRTNRYGATGDELQAIRATLDMYSQLIAVAPRGLVCRALRQAQKMVNDQLKAAHKANQQEQAA